MNRAYDVIVIGGGAAGIVAATVAGRAGAKTLLIEKSGILGGTTVLNGVNFPGLFHAWGKQIIAGPGWDLAVATVKESGGTLPDFSNYQLRHWRLQILVDPAIYAALADRMVVDSGVTLQFHTMVATAVCREDRWELQVCTKEGLQEVSGRVVIDCTGDANVVRLAGLPLARNTHRQPGTLIMNVSGYDMDKLDHEAIDRAFASAVADGSMLRSDFSAANRPAFSFLHSRGNNAVHIPDIDAETSEGKTRAELLGRAAMLRIYRFFRRQPGLENFRIDSFATECGIRETATIKGETCVTLRDYTSGKRWPDAVCYSFYPIDVHKHDGIGIDIRPLEYGVFPTLPLGALLPESSRNLLVAGRCASGDQEAHSAFRVQASCMAMGHAAACAATLAARSGKEVREIPISDIHDLLRQTGAIVP